MRTLNYQIKQLCLRNRDGSYATQLARERDLSLSATQLLELGHRRMSVHSLKPKHVKGLVNRWQNEGLSAGTIKNRMAHLRWWSEKIDKRSVIANDNATYAIADRVYVTNASKARELQGEQLAKVTDPCTAFALQLQAAFGLRLEESIKFTPAYADQGKSLVLKASWCKGGRARQIPVTTAEQRQLLDAVRAYCGGASLIPREMRYVDQLHRFKYQCGKAGIDHVHGHRHAYAQQRYRVLAGWECPACGGPTSKALTELQKEIDRSARLQISSELGHEREQITAIYLGR